MPYPVLTWVTCENRDVARLLPLVTIVLLLAGCSVQPAAGPSGSPSASTTASSIAPAPTPSTTAADTVSASASPAVTTIEIQLKDGKVSPNGDRVDLNQGDQFVLDITSDRDDEVHVHGFDKEIEVSAGLGGCLCVQEVQGHGFCPYSTLENMKRNWRVLDLRETENK